MTVGPLPFAHLDRMELDRQLSPSRSAKDPGGVLERHAAIGASLLSNVVLSVRRDLPYGPRPRQALDLFVPVTTAPSPCLVYFHGGFWQEGSRSTSGFAVPALSTLGCAVAAVGYTLAPDARIRAIVDEAAAALLYLRQHAARFGLDPDRLLVGGHSAGAHLAAALLAGQGGTAALAAVAGALLISGVYDLAPVAASYVNDLAGLDAAEIRECSPLYAVPGRNVPVHLVVGADEPDAFRQQFDALGDAWRPHLTRLTQHCAPTRDHFDVLDELADVSSPTCRALEEMLT
ncbi:MAG TPA: alpha/beta hydrolase [Luteitalea sp.]|nr:alpha/beta hydrolase [Luteitalea sp.]